LALIAMLFLPVGMATAQTQQDQFPFPAASSLDTSRSDSDHFTAGYFNTDRVDAEPGALISAEGDAFCRCAVNHDELQPDSLGYCSCGNDSFGLFDNLRLFLGFEGSKQPQEFGVNAHLGGRAAANLAIPLMEEIGLGLQAGIGFNYTDNAVQVLEGIGEVRGRSQIFTTLGLFQRSDNGLIWAAAWDHLNQSYYDRFHLDQFRGRIGWQSGNDEIGFRASISSGDPDPGRVFVFNVGLEPVTQGSAYWNHTWESGVDTMIWIGVAKNHGERNLAFEALLATPPAKGAGARVLFGAEIHAPLNDHCVLYGQGNFVTPADTGSVDSYLGFAWYPGGGARRARSGFNPVQSVANSTSFLVDLK
jgi:hypothetical protein